MGCERVGTKWEMRMSGDCEGGEGGRGWEGVRWLR